MMSKTFFVWMTIITVLVSYSLLAAEAPHESWDRSGVYFFAGGGKAELRGSDVAASDNITQLRYGVGYAFPSLSAEIGYRDYSDGKDLTVRGWDVVASQTLLQWQALGLRAGVGGYVYHSQTDNALYDSNTRFTGVAPMLTVGGDYQLHENIDVRVQYERVFNLALVSPMYDRKTHADLDQISLSVVVKPWASNTYAAPILTPRPVEVVAEVPSPPVEPEEMRFEHVWASDDYVYNSYQLTPAVKAQLNTIIAALVTQPDYVIHITGGADSRMAYRRYNHQLALRRAQAAQTYLMQHGVKPAQIVVAASLTHLAQGEADNPAARKVTIDVRRAAEVSSR